MPNKRIFYASHAVSVNGSVVNGAQSVGLNTNFNLEQVFQLGRLAIYDNISTDPDVEITITKALDGYPTIWDLATAGGGSLISKANETSTIVLAVGDETLPAIGAAVASVQMTGCFVDSLNYTFPVDGNFTEEIVFSGSNKTVGGAVGAPPTDPAPRVLRRQNLQIGNSTFPAEVVGKKLSQISISANLNREKMFSLGQYSPFHRFVNFPIEITVSFDVIQDGNGGITGPTIDEITDECAGRDFSKQEILIQLCDDSGSTAYTFDLGSGCALQGVSYSGGDTGGGNVTETYTYITYNELSIS